MRPSGRGGAAANLGCDAPAEDIGDGGKFGVQCANRIM